MDWNNETATVEFRRLRQAVEAACRTSVEQSAHHKLTAEEIITFAERCQVNYEAVKLSDSRQRKQLQLLHEISLRCAELADLLGHED